MLSDIKLIEQFNNGDNKAFEKLIKLYDQDVNRMLYVMLNGNSDDINDVKQNVLISLFSSLKKFRGDSSFKTYLYRFVKNKAIDYIRRNSMENSKLLSIFYIKNQYVESPEKKFIEEEANDEFYRHLFRLKEYNKMIIFFKDIEGKSIDEISSIVNRKPGTVKSDLHRARKKFHKILSEAGYEFM